jgi:predicted transcriptional regulator
MRRSKLEMQVDVLRVLAQKGPMQLTHIMDQANLNGEVLKGYLAFLTKQGMIEEIVIAKNTVVYANTQRGTAVVRFFGELDSTLALKDEEKYMPVFTEPQES